MALSLRESLNNVVLVCNAALMNKQERVAIDESLRNIANVLQTEELRRAAAAADLAASPAVAKSPPPEVKNNGEKSKEIVEEEPKGEQK